MFSSVRGIKLIESGRNAKSLSNPVSVVLNVALTVINYGTPPFIRLVAYCTAAGSMIIVSVINPSTVTIGSNILIINEIYDLC